MSSEASKIFEKSRTALQIEIEANNNLSEVIRKVNELHKYLIDISNDLPAYEKEKYGIDITMLVQQIADKERLREQVKPKRFQFKRRPSKYEQEEEHIESKSEKEDEVIANEITVGEEIVLNEPMCSFVDLSLCTVVSPPNPAPLSKNGSLSLHRISETVINLQKFPFQDGSVFVSECQDSVIICKLPANGHLQIRLHNLKNCKLLFESHHKQNIILEGCEDCTFHSSTQPHTIIQDFSDLNLDNDTPSTSSSYQFQNFETLGMDTAALKERYVSN